MTGSKNEQNSLKGKIWSTKSGRETIPGRENRQATTSRWGSPYALYWNGKEAAVLDCNTGSYRVIGENGSVGTWTKNLIIEEPN